MNTTGQVMPNGDTVYYEDSKARDMFADAYDSTKSYAVGKHCIKDDVLYICNTAIPSGGETWNSAHWTATTFDAEVIQIKSNLMQKQDVMQFNTWTPSASDYPSSANTSALSFIRWGNMCTLVGILRVSTASTSITLLSNIANEFLPKYVNLYISAQWYGDNSGCDIKIDLNGSLTCAIPSGSVNKDIKVMGAWICNG
jgi:hypothetical protein